MWRHGRCGDVDVVEMLTSWRRGRCGDADIMETWTLWIPGRCGEKDSADRLDTTDDINCLCQKLLTEGQLSNNSNFTSIDALLIFHPLKHSSVHCHSGYNNSHITRNAVLGR